MDNILTGLQSLLRYHSSIGLSHYPRNEDVESFLRVLPKVKGEAESFQVKVAVPVRPLQQEKAPAVLRSPVKISEIREEVTACHACELHKQRLYPVAGRGPDKIRLLIVGDWLSADVSGDLPPDHLFGVMQDQMLNRMLMAIKLSASDVFITNVIKCAVPGSCQPLATHVQSCVSYLRRQILSLLPEVICTMGMVAARAVLQKSQPLSRLRGQFHEYEVEKERTIPVIPTYHPTYLLQNPEMKQATWADLQLLAKRMGLMKEGN
ncbi:MAG: uracil-DNA glycosylase [Desulfobulbaceae bacterium]|nr:uracil-DNA glycosylase [Desulfobulbaceae bacterium]